MMDRGQSSDDEEDQQALIHQNDTRTKSPPHRSTFHIDEFNNSTNLRISSTFFNNKRRYLLAIFLPLFFVLIYFTADLKNLFQSNVSSANFDASVNRMRESELQALYLLRNQQLGLLNLWNRTTLLNQSSNNLSLNDVVKSTILTQISLNKQIQQALLSSHQFGDLLDLADNNINHTSTDPSTVSYFAGICQKLDSKFSERRTIEWKPKLDKYLFAICVSGQMSNHLICLEKHMFFAAVLNRVLVIPSSKVDYDLSRVIDIDHINKCLGRKVVVTFEEFAESKKNHLHIDRVICYFSLPTPCFLDDDHIKKLKNLLGVSLNKLEPAWVEDVKKPTLRTSQDVVAKFSSDDDVIAVGDVFFADVEKEWVMQPGGPIAHTCKTLIEPSRLIMLTAQRFIQTFVGEGFTALHFRRHGFLKFCNAKKPSCFFPVPQAADCISRMVERAHTPVIYLSTDAAESETRLLQSLIMSNGKAVPLVTRPARNSAEKWDALLYRHSLQDDPQVEAMLDKTICALSSVYIGSSGSTFTEDILRLRKDWGTASECDEYLCEGEEPNFIAEDE